MKSCTFPMRCIRWGGRLALLGLVVAMMSSCGAGDRKIVNRYEETAREMTINPLSPRALPDGVRDGFCGYDKYWWEIQVTIARGRMVKIEVVEVGQEEYRTAIEPYIESVLKAQSPVVEFPEDDLMVKGFLKAVEYSLMVGGK